MGHSPPSWTFVGNSIAGASASAVAGGAAGPLRRAWPRATVPGPATKALALVWLLRLWSQRLIRRGLVLEALPSAHEHRRGDPEHGGAANNGHQAVILV